MRKGFIHIVEIIIVALVVFILVVQLSSIPKREWEWERAKLRLQGYDVLSTLDKMGVNWFDKETIKNRFSGLFGKNIRYDLKIKNAIKSNISVGCICTEEEYLWLSSVLIPFKLNNQTIRFYVKWIDPYAPSFPVNLDVIFIGNKFFEIYDLDAFRGEIETYLSYNKGIVEMRDFNSSEQIAKDSVQREIFKLKWDESITINSNRLVLNSYPKSVYYIAYKYFYHIPTIDDLCIKNVSCKFLNFLNGEKVAPYDDLKERVLVKQIGTNASAVILNNKAFNDAGRTVWISSGEEKNELKQQLVRSVVVWASGQTYHIIKNVLPKPVKIYYLKLIEEDDFTPGMFQPLEIELGLSFVY